MTISLTGVDPTSDSHVRISGAASMGFAEQSDGPQTPAGIQEPAAVVSKSLERLNTGTAESKTNGADLRTDQGNGTTAPEVTFHKGLNELLDEGPSAFAVRVQTEITTSAEIAVLAQAQQLPGGPMPYSGEA